jgi:hypothetical protein
MMKFPYLLFFLIPIVGLAQTSSPEKAVKLLSEVQDTVTHLAPTEVTCCLCQSHISEEAKTPGLGLACEDLFGVACLNPDGTSKFKNGSQILKAKITHALDEARDKSAKVLGFESFDDGLKKKLKEAGLGTALPMDEESWMGLKQEGKSKHSYGFGPKLFSVAKDCEEQIKPLQDSSYVSLTDIPKLREFKSNTEKFFTTFNEKKIAMNSLDIPNFIDDITGQCKDFETSNNQTPELNPEATKICKDKALLKEEAVRLFRLEGTPEYKKEAELFVRAHFIPPLRSKPPSFISAPEGSTPELIERYEMIKSISSELGSVYSYCYGIGMTSEKAGTRIFEDFANSVNRSKPTVDGIIDSLYGDDKKKRATEILRSAKADIVEIVGQFVKDEKKKKAIVEGYGSLDLLWMTKPKDTFYKKNAQGVMELDLSQGDGNPFNEASLAVFADPSLSYFTQVNADYLPTMTIGAVTSPERVNMLPSFLVTLENSPYDFLTVVAHEAGHKIGPAISKLNGYDLGSEYADLLNCYKDKKSIRLQNGQEDETLADYISSEVLARQISRMPVEQRSGAVLTAMKDFCLFDEEEEGSSSFKATHPSNRLRVGGIYGGNPHLRKILGCEADSSKFKTCGIEGLSL